MNNIILSCRGKVALVRAFLGYTLVFRIAQLFNALGLSPKDKSYFFLKVWG